MHTSGEKARISDEAERIGESRSAKGAMPTQIFRKYSRIVL